jgi:hypothetical protein
MKRIKNKIKDWFAVLLMGGAVGSFVAMILLYIIGIFCLPVAIIWAIYKLVTHFTN